MSTSGLMRHRRALALNEVSMPQKFGTNRNSVQGILAAISQQPQKSECSILTDKHRFSSASYY